MKLNRIGDAGLTALAKALESVPLQRLFLGGNRGISAEGVGVLAASLPASKLLELHLNGCGLGNEAPERLAPHLERGPLQELDLSWNKGISAIGLEALAKGNASPGCKLEKLDVQHCDLGDAAIQKFSAHLPSMAPLRR